MRRRRTAVLHRHLAHAIDQYRADGSAATFRLWGRKTALRGGDRAATAVQRARATARDRTARLAAVAVAPATSAPGPAQPARAGGTARQPDARRLHGGPARRGRDLRGAWAACRAAAWQPRLPGHLAGGRRHPRLLRARGVAQAEGRRPPGRDPERSEEHTSELQSRGHLVCRLLL